MSINKTALRIDQGAVADGATADAAHALPGLAPDRPDPRMRAEIAGYIFQMSGEMTSMARAAKMDLVAYFLEMARIEAGSLRQID